MELVYEARGKIIKIVCVTSHACQKQEYLTFSTPIKIMQFDAVYVYKVAFVGGLVHIYLLFYEKQWLVLGIFPFAFYNFYPVGKTILNGSLGIAVIYPYKVVAANK
jgi:hypothetical protein